MNILDEILESLGYIALPLSRDKSMVGGIYRINKKRLTKIRGSEAWISSDLVQSVPSSDFKQLEKDFEFSFSSFFSFLPKVLGRNKIKTVLKLKSIKSVSITLKDMVQEEISIGDIADLLEGNTLPQKIKSEMLNDKHLTIISALKVGHMVWNFFDKTGAVIHLSDIKIKQLVDAGIDSAISVSKKGQVSINRPSYFGYAFYNGKQWRQTINERRQFSTLYPEFADTRRESIPVESDDIDILGKDISIGDYDTRSITVIDSHTILHAFTPDQFIPGNVRKMAIPPQEIRLMLE